MQFPLPSTDQFNHKDCTIAGDDCVLITPKDMGMEWNDNNKYFRSSIWRKSDAKLISAGFRKFTNYGEKPAFEPFPQNTMLCAVEKKDGSLLIVSDHKDQLVVRTRGTVDASCLPNGHEIEFLKTKYPKAFNNEWLEAGCYSLLFEWTTPSNRIVLQESEEPCLWLIGMIYHHDYSYVDQFCLNQYAEEMGVLRPKTHRFLMSDTLDDIKKQIEPLQNIEGVVVYDESGQVLKKIKTPRYLELHRVHTGVKTVDHLFDLYVEYGNPARSSFEEELAKKYDWELVTTLKPLMDELYHNVKKIAAQVFKFVELMQDVEFVALDRKGKAQKIMELYPGEKGVAFAMLDGKELDLHKLWKTYIAS